MRMDIEKRMGEAAMRNMSAIQMATFWFKKVNHIGKANWKVLL